MSGYRLTVKEPPRQRVDLSALLPERLAAMKTTEVAGIEFFVGNRRQRLDSLFEIKSQRDPDLLEIVGDAAKFDAIGKGMTGGVIKVRGDVGAYVGTEMNGGEIEIDGDAGAWAGAAMLSGLLRIAGNAGDYLAAAIPGERRGMLGGTIVVAGNAGIRAGDLMRRGMVLIGGSAGAYCCSRMIAGTVAVLGDLGSHPGYGMKRGSLILFREPARLPPTFTDSGGHDLGYLRLMARHWDDLGAPFGGMAAKVARARRFAGDAANGGQGEILVCGT